MFLDDELLLIGRSVELNEKSINETISKMINACFANLNKNIEGKPRTNQTILSSFKRVNNTWIKVSKRLDKEGIGFVKTNGFQIFVESESEFKGLFFN